MMSDYWNECKVFTKDRILKKQAVAQAARIGQLEFVRFVDDLAFRQHVDRITDEIVIELYATVYEEDVGKDSVDVEFTRPATWFDHLVIDHAPEWFKEKIYQPKTIKDTRQVNVSFKARYPEFKPANKMPVVIIREVEYSPMKSVLYHTDTN